MRTISETHYYKALAKLYEKCAQLSSQLDIYEDDRHQTSEDSNLLALPPSRPKKVNKRVSTTKLEEGSHDINKLRTRRFPRKKRVKKQQFHIELQTPSISD